MGRKGDEAMSNPALVQLAKITGRELDVGAAEGVASLGSEAVRRDRVVADPCARENRGLERKGPGGPNRRSREEMYPLEVKPSRKKESRRGGRRTRRR